MGFFLISLSVWFFKMKFNCLPDLLNTGLTIVEIGLFYDSEHLGVKICRFLTCFDKITARYRFSTYLIGDGDMRKHFKYWLCSSNVLLKHWNYSQRTCWVHVCWLMLLQINFSFWQSFSECFPLCFWTLSSFLKSSIFLKLFFMYNFLWFLFYSIWT